MASVQMKLLIKMMMRMKTQYDPTYPKDYISEREANDKRASRMKPEKGISIKADHVNGTPIEIYYPHKVMNDNLIFYIHGGGFNNGSIISSRPFATELAHRLGTKVLSIQYKLAPEHKYPTQLEECMVVYQWLIEGIARNCKIILHGDSAGGNLVLALTHCIMHKQIKRPAALCVISPPTDFTGNLTSRLEKEKVDCIITRSFDSEIRDTYIGSVELNNPYISPLNGNFTDFPPLRIDVGSEEMLLDDSILLEKKSRSAGVYVEAQIWDGLCHVFPLFPIPEKKKYFNELGAFIKRYS